MSANYLIVKLIFFCFVLTIIIGCNSSGKVGKQMVFPTDLTVIEPCDSVKFDTSWFDSKYKVAVYMNKVGRSITTLDWQPAISNNKVVAFLFYISEKDPSKLIRQLKENNFSHPVIHDPNKEFYKANGIGEVSFISFLLKDDRKIEMSNSSFPNFQERLEALTRK
ncbi:hypothetical protein [Cyclobacterium sp.]|uniref:hypothetical protein n=1 Tax=Cyclobacterium sp. TaxID=1966343 RepID=UPI001992CB47|nr:hypothetical protein [Cyclobacterium sp.]MBD3626649.1 hypothetical protein [Cyclobacterium sp.]